MESLGSNTPVIVTLQPPGLVLMTRDMIDPTWRFMGSYKWGCKGSFKGPSKGLYGDLGFRA